MDACAFKGFVYVSLRVLLALFCLADGCSSKPKTTAEGKPVSGTDEQIFLGDTIEKNYDPNVIMKRGEAFFDKEEYRRGHRRISSISSSCIGHINWRSMRNSE